MQRAASRARALLAVPHAAALCRAAPCPQRDMEGGVDYCRRKVLLVKDKLEQLSQLVSKLRSLAAGPYGSALCRAMEHAAACPWLCHMRGAALDSVHPLLPLPAACR